MTEDRDFEDFCRAEYGSVYRACFAFSGSRDMALDCTQEAFSRAFARWRRLSKHEWAGGWVMTTALNLAKRALRAKPIPQSPPTVAGEPLDLDLQMDVIEALRSLSLRQRQAVVLHYLADLPVGAVAELMNASEGSVKTHPSRARRTLGTILIARQTGGEA
jgi:RNA polymerase sigma-70 factor (ECF subfamily)